MADSALQNSLFEEDYLLRELGPVAHVPHVALTELVANAWDAGASRVDIQIPEKAGDNLTVQDDGHGMTAAQFSKRWMTLRYDRLKYQGEDVEFPAGRSGRQRKAYGRNGVGRHGLLCFGDEYQVETWRDGVLITFLVGTESGPSPFVLRNKEAGSRKGNGTRLIVRVERHLPDPEEILTILAAKFIHDPEFEIRVNGSSLPMQDLEGIVSSTEIDFGGGNTATVIVIDSTCVNHSSVHQGVAFWVKHRLVGTPSWTVGQTHSFDGRTRFARRYKVIVDTHGFESEVEPDWTSFKKSERVHELFKKTTACIIEVAASIAAEVIEESLEDALTENRLELAGLGRGAQYEVTEFTKAIAQAHPTVSPDFLATAVNAVINLEKTKSGAALLQKLSALPADDIDSLDRLLEEWSVKDALRVLDEIDSRLSVIETIRRISGDPNTDELHTLHPLVLRSRWLFGPEFESEEYCSNVSLQTVARELFKNKMPEFENPKKRPDIVILPDKTTIEITGIESFDPIDSTLVRLQNILLIELKKGGFSIGRNEVNQADGYVQDIANSGLLTGTPFIHAWVVGQTIAPGVARVKTVSDGNVPYGQIRATTFGQLVDTANKRLLKLRERLQGRYGDIPTDTLLERVLGKPHQFNVPSE
ncbi:ATP-binding protein [Methylomonas methanica]|uniref:ATP-binding protein n=1 Tax=Methylomonas methanica TaxID=421 RepID=UPI0007C96F69|nr:ATP-binding protein [Methylomonas methanica]